MIIASINGPAASGYGLGEATFVKGTNFNCNVSICYGIGTANHELLKQLQQAINSFATLARFTPVTVDGFIGAGTVNAGSLAARVARGQGAGGDSTLLAQLASGMTKEQIAANAPGLLAALTTANSTLVSQGAPVQALAPTAAPTTTAIAPAPSADTGSFTKAVDFVKSFFQPSASPTPGGFAPTPTPGVPTAPSAAAVPGVAPTVTPPKKVPLWVWIFAGVGGVIVLGGIGYAIFRKPAPEPARPALPPPSPTAAKAVAGRRHARRYRRCRSCED